MKADDIDMVTTDIEIAGWFIVMKKIYNMNASSSNCFFRKLSRNWSLIMCSKILLLNAERNFLKFQSPLCYTMTIDISKSLSFFFFPIKLALNVF